MQVKTENLEYVYMAGTPYAKTAISDINIEINSGEFVGLIGHTGSGKSTLIQHLNGLIKPTSGRVLVDGKDINSKEVSLRSLRFKIGLVFQYPEYQLFDETVLSDISFGPKNLGLSEAEAHARAREAMELVGLPASLETKSPLELSGGQKRRVAIAGVLAMKPELLILDEPAAGLDPKGRNEILSRIKDLHEKQHMSILLVSHSMEDIAKMAERVLIIKDGKIAREGTPEEIFGLGDELLSCGLDVPQITKLINKIRASGISLSENIYTVSKAEQELLKLFKQ
ncbi:MAG: energy-coupling factor transporter ATPase [Clostridia bacterium]|nr:energy-coupling factor transporter ATPase [Clostridia bacterium]